MTVWWNTLMITFICGALATYTGRDRRTSRGVIYRQPNPVFAFLGGAVLIFVSAFRNGVGDTGTYRDLYRRAPESIGSFFDTVELKGEWGMTLYYTLIKQFISKNTQWLIIISAIITIGLIAYMFYKYAENLELAIFYFITLGCYLVTMNGIRQYLVAAISFAAFPWLVKRKWYLYIPLSIALSTIHTSAFVFVVLYFVVNKKAWGSWTKWLLLAGVFLFVTYPVTGPMIADLLQETEYGHYGKDLISGEGGANTIRILVYAVPVILSFIGRKDKEIQERFGYNVMVNMSILNFIFMMLANRYWIYARFNIYFNVYAILLLCWEVKYLFEEQSKRFVYISSLVLFTVYYWYDMAVSLGYGAGYIHFITKWR